MFPFASNFEKHSSFSTFTLSAKSFLKSSNLTGAIALAAANSVTMLEHSVYSVISPEGCASILWRDGEQSKEAADSLKLTAQNLLSLGVIENIVPEPLGGAHRDPEETINAVGDVIEEDLRELGNFDGGVLKSKRREKFLKIGSKISV